MISHGTGIGAAQANLKVTRNAISDGYFGNIAIYGNLNAADNTFFIYDAALPTIGGVGLANNLISTASNSAWRQLVYFYQDSSLAMTKLQLDAIFAGNTIQDYAYATNSSGVPGPLANPLPVATRVITASLVFPFTTMLRNFPR